MSAAGHAPSEIFRRPGLRRAKGVAPCIPTRVPLDPVLNVCRPNVLSDRHPANAASIASPGPLLSNSDTRSNMPSDASMSRESPCSTVRTPPALPRTRPEIRRLHPRLGQESQVLPRRQTDHPPLRGPPPRQPGTPRTDAGSRVLRRRRDVDRRRSDRRRNPDRGRGTGKSLDGFLVRKESKGTGRRNTSKAPSSPATKS